MEDQRPYYFSRKVAVYIFYILISTYIVHSSDHARVLSVFSHLQPLNNSAGHCIYYLFQTKSGRIWLLVAMTGGDVLHSCDLWYLLIEARLHDVKVSVMLPRSHINTIILYLWQPRFHFFKY